ncbi:peptide deformylase [Companilactobacillus sp. DQM5]|uniref:peptide deformylase n=1 Tax=Companilactobacillus sp. DQM5 TaxID=3463359 RepID=UPI00405895BF
MIRPINKDTIILKKKSKQATINDLTIGNDLLDTLKANSEICVGMAANMIAINKRIIVVQMGILQVVMYNPKIISKNKPFQTEEGCLSLSGQRPTTRYENIELSYYDNKFKHHKQNFDGFVAQIIQHEIDHCDGILI